MGSIVGTTVMGKLTTLQVKNAKPGRYSDGDGLMLIVKDSGARSWLLRIQYLGRRMDIGLGSAKVISLSDARERASETRKLIRSGGDPIAARRASQSLLAALPSFREAATALHGEREGSWKNHKHRAQWLSSLEAYAFPDIGSTPIDKVTGPAVLDLVSKIWQEKPETAKRVLQRVTAVLDWAHAKGHRPSEAPLRSIRLGLARQTRAVKHHEFLPYADVAPLMAKLRESDTVGRLALRFLILTAARSGEVRGAIWEEIDLAGKTWTVPASRMKAKKAHVVPLSPAAIEVLRIAERLRKGKNGEPIFPGKGDKPQSDMTLTKVLRTAKPGMWTVHGFRSSFRIWAAEKVDGSRELAEEALAHVLTSKVEASYRRTNLLEKRRTLMDVWAKYADPHHVSRG